MSIEDQIQDHWQIGECPLVDGIIYADGFFIPLSVENGDGKFTVRRLGEPHYLGSIQRFVPADINALCSYRHYQIGCGSSSMGGDGFVCLVEGKLLRWIAFFRFSNPFVNIQLSQDSALVTNNWGYRMKLHLPRPATVQEV